MRCCTVSIALSALLAFVGSSTAALPPILIDGFDIAVGTDSLGSETAGVLDANGQAGIQVPAISPTILGGERDSQFFVGFGDPGDSWEFGVDPIRGLFWESGPTIHVNMFLDWDGSGDGSTFGPSTPTTPYSSDFSEYGGIELVFGSSSADLQVGMSIGNRDEATSVCGANCGFITGFSRILAVDVPGGQDEPFSVFLPFAAMEDPFADFGIPAADLAGTNFLGVSVLSAPGVTNNDLVLRSVSVVVPEPTTCTLGLIIIVGFVAARRSH